MACEMNNLSKIGVGSLVLLLAWIGWSILSYPLTSKVAFHETRVREISKKLGLLNQGKMSAGLWIDQKLGHGNKEAYEFQLTQHVEALINLGAYQKEAIPFLDARQRWKELRAEVFPVLSNGFWSAELHTNEIVFTAPTGKMPALRTLIDQLEQTR